MRRSCDPIGTDPRGRPTYLPAKRLPSRGDQYIVIDWERALEQATHTVV